MKEYILTVAAAAVLSAIAAISVPKNWVGYIRLITGAVILCSIISPVMNIIGGTIKFEPENGYTYENYDEYTYNELIKEDLEKRIEEDIKARVRKEYGIDIAAEVEIEINENNEIEGVKKITVTDGHITEAVKNRLYEIYGAGEVE